MVGAARARVSRQLGVRRVARDGEVGERGRRRARRPARPCQRVERRAGERGDALLDGLDGAELVEQVADAVEPAVVEVRVADGVLDLGHRGAREPRCAVGPLHGERDQQGALALAQVVARGLAGDRRVAEHAEQVVAQLEGDADVGAEAAVARRPGPGPAPASAAPRCSGRSTV